MIIIKIIYLIGGICFILGSLIYLFFRHQRRLKARAFLMREAVRNGDYAFRLPTSGLLPGERALQQALNDMQGDIARLVARHEVESWQKLTRVLTHEIMNTIAPIISLSQTLSAYPDNSEKTLRGLHIIQAQSERLLEFTESFRRLSYLPQPERKRFSLTALLQNLQELLSTDFQENQIHFTLTCQPEFIDMDGDENQLSQVLLNLLRNSIQALDGRTDGAIEIYAYRDEHISIDVTDNGPGIPDELQEKIFIPFFTTKSEGTGIGLSLCRQIIRNHNGHLSILESRPGKTIFHIDISL